VKILLTGASSFSGYWFAHSLARAGATVVAPLRADPKSYDGVRGERVRQLAAIAEIIPETAFGDDHFLKLVQERDFDVLCHHAARVTDYRSMDFDVIGAVAENTRNFRMVIEHMAGRGLKAVIATGSVFEQDEGLGEPPLRAFSPYGLSKGLSWQVVRHWCVRLGVPVGKFVIANPFGPLEEPRFVSYLVGCWRKGHPATVRTPRYLRDNIHVGLLALAYCRFVFETVASARSARFGPSGYVETQGNFAERVATELRPRLKLPCCVELLVQTEFPEPISRVNTEMIDVRRYSWVESEGWDRLAAFYSGAHADA
jgi:UDP-glucose 4-epimerase